MSPNRIDGFRARLFFAVALAFASPAVVADGIPRLPFHGVYGGTLGAGSVTGWERHGGENPAAVTGMEPDAPPVRSGSGARATSSLAVAGYLPFGLEEVRVTEVMAARDGGAFGASLRWTSLHDGGAGAPDRHAGRVRAQAAWRPFTARAFSIGAHLDASYDGFQEASRAGHPGADGTARAPDAALGLLWRPGTAFGFGASAESGGWHAGGGARPPAVRLGADAGLPPGPFGSVRLAVERHLETPWQGAAAAASWRIGGVFRPHPLLAILAGRESASGQIALGIRFGAGSLNLSSALRRHALLGGTSVQSLEWKPGVER